MRYLALLRDSLREARDTKVIYFTLGLAIFVVLLLLTISFRPLSVRETLDFPFSMLNWAYRMEASPNPGEEPVVIDVTQFEQVNDSPHPWEGDYRMTVTLKFPKKGALTEETNKKKQDQIYKVLYATLFGMGLKNVNIVQAVSTNSDRVEFHITTKGTRVKSQRDWVHEPSIFFGAMPISIFRTSLNGAVYGIEDVLVNRIGGWIIILIAIIVTAFFIPNMLQKGTVDLLLVKPVFRFELLLVKFFGGLTFVFLNSVVAIGGVWLVLGLRTGIWATGFLMSIFIITFFFAILYSVSALFAVLVRSSVLCIFVPLIVWLALFILGVVDGWLYKPEPQTQVVAQQDVLLDADKKPPDPGELSPALRQAGNVVHVFYLMFPRISELGQLNSQIISDSLFSENEYRQPGAKKIAAADVATSFGVSLAFIGVMLGLGCWRFSTTDY